MRYVVVGSAGCGKSTLARALAEARQVPYVELDALYWGAGWTPRPKDEFIGAVSRATQGERWVVDGNYSAVRPLLWPRATHVVWLNFGRGVVFLRVIWRTLKRALLREPLWNGNRESVRRAFFSKDSIVLWSLSTYRRNIDKFSALRDDPAHAHLDWIELRTPREAEHLLAAMGLPSSADTDSRSIAERLICTDPVRPEVSKGASRRDLAQGFDTSARTEAQPERHF